jgi:hypothetical protein
MGKKLMEFDVYCGRMGSLEGRFILDDAEQAELDALMGKEIYFGEVLGKHSEVIIKLEPAYIKVVTDNESFLNEAARLGISLAHGFDPLQTHKEYVQDNGHAFGEDE